MIQYKNYVYSFSIQNCTLHVVKNLNIIVIHSQIAGHFMGKLPTPTEPTGTDPRCEVQLSNGQMRRLKKECVSIVALTAGVRVIVFGLQSDSGKKINGKCMR